MNFRSLNSIFKPKRIALCGATQNPNSVSGKILGNLVGGGFRGVVYPVNPSYEAVLGIQCHPSLASLPHKPDLVMICTAAAEVPQVVRQCAAQDIRGVIVVSAGFREIGPEGVALEDEIRAVLQENPSMRVLGPNCLGVIVPGMNLNASFGEGLPRKGNIAFISQSGALCTSVLDWAIGENIGFSYFVSIGNAIDVDVGDLIDYFGEDEETESILLYVESINDARRFMTAARAFAKTKPIIVYKAGRFPESAKVAASHTGALAAEDDVYDAAFQRAGVTRVYEIGDIFDVAEMLGRKKTPAGPALGIITNAGGPGVMATDALIANRGVLAKLSDETMEKLNASLPPYWSHGNPVDVLGDARSKRIAKAVSIVLEDGGVDAVLVILTPQAMTSPEATAREIARLNEKSKKPVLAAWIGGERMEKGMQVLYQAGIPAYRTPEQAIRAFMTLVAYSRNLRTLYETPRDIPVEFPLNRKTISSEQIVPESGSFVSELNAKKLLASYGIPVSMPESAATSFEAVELAEKMGYPVVMKIDSDAITHKSDAGGVRLNLCNQEAVMAAWDSMMEQVRAYDPDAVVKGVTIQPMVKMEDSLELILGAKRDPVFGTVILVGMGGVTAELFADRALGFPPLNERLARLMLESLKIWPLLKGYRGRPAVDIDKLVGIMIRLSYLAADYPDMAELDINPLLVSPEGVCGLDARVLFSAFPDSEPGEKYPHLSLHPYPEEYVQKSALPDGTPVLLRPIRPEDEPMWLEMLSKCSKESIYQRFRYFFNWNSHEVATSYCYIDYDREVAIVAETIEGPDRHLVGVGRLITDPAGDDVEYAVLVTDEWQNRRLGSLLTDFCVGIARRWKKRRIVAQTTTTNPRMINVFQKKGFTVHPDRGSGIVEVEMELAGS